MNCIENLAQEYLNARGIELEDTFSLTLLELGQAILEDLSCESHNTYQCEISSANTKDRIPHILEFHPTKEEMDDLLKQGLAKIIGTTEEGTVQFVEIGFLEFLILQEGTIITRAEDNWNNEDAFWPYDLD